MSASEKAEISKQKTDRPVYDSAHKKKKTVGRPTKASLTSAAEASPCQHQLGSVASLRDGANFGIIMDQRLLEETQTNPQISTISAQRLPCFHYYVTLAREPTAAWLKNFRKSLPTSGSPLADSMQDEQLCLLALDIARLKGRLSEASRLALIAKLSAPLKPV